MFCAGCCLLTGIHHVSRLRLALPLLLHPFQPPLFCRWGSTEYSSGEGSVLGGRWKPSHYFLARGYADVLSACGVDARCFVKNDNPLAPLTGTFKRALLRLRDSALLPLPPAPIALPAGAGAIAWSCLDGGSVPRACNSSSGFGVAVASTNCTYAADTDYQGGSGGSSVAAADAAACCAACASEVGCVAAVFYLNMCYTKGSGGAPVASPGRLLCSPPPQPPPCTPLATLLSTAGCAPDGTDCLLRLTVVDASGAEIAVNEQLLAPPGKLAITPTAVTARVGDVLADGTVPVTLTASGAAGPALFVTLFTRANGRFSENAVTLIPGAEPTVIAFMPFADAQAALLRDSLRVNHLAQFVGDGARLLE